MRNDTEKSTDALWKKNERDNKGCPLFGKCGSCRYLDLTYPQQLAKKQKLIRRLMEKHCEVNPILGMEDPWYYRHKVQAVFGMDRKKNPISGVYEEKSHRLLPVENCLIEDRKADEIIGTIRGMLRSFKIRVYDENTGYGLLRYVMIRKGYSTGEIMVVLVTASPIFPSRKNFVSALLKAHPEITTVVQNVNDRTDSMVLGERFQTLHGKGYIMDELCGCRFKISPASFYQVNPVQAARLYEKAVELAGLTGRETVVDAYCGTGTIGIIAAKKAGKVIGVESNPDAVKDCISNAKTNGVKNIRFYREDAGRFLKAMAADGIPADVVIMDPPRAGSSREFLDALGTLKPERIVYVSCNPETMERDVSVLEKCGYRGTQVWPVDMFPWTAGVETVVLLSKGEIDSKKVRVEFSLEDMDMSGFQKGATYEQIKTYVLEHTGLKVSSLYISQIKRKCGLDVGQNYNLSKKEDAKVPQCPPEKEAAIRDALKYFQMI